MAIHQYEPAVGVRVSPRPEPPPTSLPTLSLQVSQSIGFGCPASYIKLTLAFHCRCRNGDSREKGTCPNPKARLEPRTLGSHLQNAQSGGVTITKMLCTEVSIATHKRCLAENGLAIPQFSAYQVAFCLTLTPQLGEMARLPCGFS